LNWLIAASADFFYRFTMRMPAECWNINESSKTQYPKYIIWIFYFIVTNIFVRLICFHLSIRNILLFCNYTWRKHILTSYISPMKRIKSTGIKTLWSWLYNVWHFSKQTSFHCIKLYKGSKCVYCILCILFRICFEMFAKLIRLYSTDCWRFYSESYGFRDKAYDK